jgi:hypothetical protein
MKKIAIGITIIALPLIWFAESRKFFLLTDGTHVTVWKTYGNVSFILPDNYYGIFPRGNYIKTSNINTISIYKKSGSSDSIFFSSQSHFEVNNSDVDNSIFADLEIFQNPDLRRLLNEKMGHRDFKDWATLRLDIRENYAMDENGLIQK